MGSLPPCQVYGINILVKLLPEAPPGVRVYCPKGSPIRYGVVVGRGDIEAQSLAAVENLRLALAAEGAELTDIVKTTIYVAASDKSELVRAWVDEIPESELASHYAKAVADLDEHDLSMLAAWHASMEVGTPLANKDFLVGAFKSLGDNRREALKIAAGLRGEDAFNAGVAEEQALESVLPWLSRERATELLAECLELYVWDRAGSDN